MANHFKRTMLLFTFIFLGFLSMELVFRVGVLNIFITDTLFRMALFVFVYSVIATAIFKFFGRVGLLYALPVFFALLTAYFFSQTLYNSVVDGFYSFNMLTDAGDGAGFSEDIFSALRLWHVLYFIPFLLTVFLAIRHRRLKGTWYDLFDGHYRSYRSPLYMAVFSVAIFIGAIASIPEASDEDIDEDMIYDRLLSTRLAVDRFGLMTYAHRDVANVFREPVGLTDEDKRSEEFLENRPEHSENNPMTDIFEDKNLIYITAESLDTFALHPELMPNYFDMLDNAYHFENFYAPLYYRTTADTEFMKLTSYFPNQNVRLSMDEYKDNHFPNTLPRLFSELGYDTQAFHNYSDHYYPRNTFHPETIGFDNYTGAENMGLWDEDHDGPQHPWPSDLEMMENTMDDFLGQDRFFAYYLTVTGHLPYSDNHDIASEHLDTIIDIMEDHDMDTDIPEELLYYHAAHYEFDRALGYMVDRLKAEGVYEDTVIVIASDHYAYGLSDSVIEGYDTRKNLEETDLNMHKVPMMIHHPDIEGTHTVDNTISSVDMTPTLANMFALPIRYHEIMGYDAFEGEGAPVSFQDLSFMRQGYFLEVERDLNIHIRDEQYTEADVLADFNHLTKRREISRYILETDFLERYTD